LIKREEKNEKGETERMNSWKAIEILTTKKEKYGRLKKGLFCYL